MIYKNKPECKTISVWVPVETYDALMSMANDRAKRDGQWCSLSRLVRDILMCAASAEKNRVHARDVFRMAMEDHHGRA